MNKKTSERFVMISFEVTFYFSEHQHSQGLPKQSDVNSSALRICHPVLSGKETTCEHTQRGHDSKTIQGHWCDFRSL